MSERYYELDQEEQELLDAVERGEFVEVKNKRKVITELQQAAIQQNNKTRNINIRIPERTLFKLKAQAIAEGLPYQTHIASVLYKQVK